MTNTSKKLLFVGSYTPENEPGIHTFIFDSTTGIMFSHGHFAGIKNPSFLTIHPNKKWLFAVSETGRENDGVFGSVHSFGIQNGHSGMDIQPINKRSTVGDWPCHLQIDASGRWIMVSNYGTGNAALFPILSNGALGEMKTLVQHKGQGPNVSRQEGPHAHSATFSPDNRFVIVADLGIDQLVIYKFDEATGSLSRHTAIPAHPGAGPRHLAFHPKGQHVLVANELDSTVTLYDYDAEIGALHALQTLSTLPSDAPENSVADIHFSTSGEYVYVSNRGHNSIAVFGFGTDSRLNRLVIRSCRGNWPRNFALSPDDQFILVANRYSDELSVMPILSGGAEIGTVFSRVEVKQPSCVQFF